MTAAGSLSSLHTDFHFPFRTTLAGHKQQRAKLEPLFTLVCQQDYGSATYDRKDTYSITNKRFRHADTHTKDT
ncbi:hypothetical protein DdX_02923 [Ditylenchus destructor]|uniref:Uncharacterized protein n=1 Tax=Ditylenchus destructor TaxID=166010 RepID=A0AAD4NIB2_9BILA|nr:hypothetical protein DdX_02923 [Ditylenchus destructor]